MSAELDADLERLKREFGGVNTPDLQKMIDAGYLTPVRTAEIRRLIKYREDGVLRAQEAARAGLESDSREREARPERPKRLAPRDVKTRQIGEFR